FNPLYIKRQEQKGELISDFYRSNITKKAIAERWELDILAKQQEKAKIEKAERERKKVEEQAEQARKEKEKQKLEEQRQFLIEQFEVLSPKQQENVINEIFEQVGKGAFKQIFQTARQQGTVHIDARFVKNFYNYFQQEERAKRARKRVDLPIQYTEEDIEQEVPKEKGTIFFGNDWNEYVYKQLIMYRDFKSMMNDDAIK
ncbi:TPA: hypothetical protein ACJJJG_001936, partial [Neisseria meningitidis]